MNFFNYASEYFKFDFDAFFAQVTAKTVNDILAQEQLSAADFLALLSCFASEQLELMAQKAQNLTQQHFGRTIEIYTPFYVSDHCQNSCVYCGFSVQEGFDRTKLTFEQIDLEAAALAAAGFKQILLLTGESRQQTPPEYLNQCVKILKKYFSSVALEVYPLTEQEYRQLVEFGVDGLTVYQETYQPALYARLHLSGPKSDYAWRLDTPERAAYAGMRFINIGSLLGLADWKKDIFFTGLHAQYLQDKFPQVAFSVSLPRLRLKNNSQLNAVKVNDQDFLQALLAIRLFLPRLGITLSTREPAWLRDNLVSLGVTRMSAQSVTLVGGHSLAQNNCGSATQFDISDTRSLSEIKTVLKQKGYQPVMKNWQSF